jgi:hypothetical protein
MFFKMFSDNPTYTVRIWAFRAELNQKTVMKRQVGKDPEGGLCDDTIRIGFRFILRRREKIKNSESQLRLNTVE